MQKVITVRGHKFIFKFEGVKDKEFIDICRKVLSDKEVKQAISEYKINLLPFFKRSSKTSSNFILPIILCDRMKTAGGRATTDFCSSKIKLNYKMLKYNEGIEENIKETKAKIDEIFKGIEDEATLNKSPHSFREEYGLTHTQLGMYGRHDVSDATRRAVKNHIQKIYKEKLNAAKRKVGGK